MIEAELKARVNAPEVVMRLFDERATARVEVYRDTYYDRPDGSLEQAGEDRRRPRTPRQRRSRYSYAC